MPAKAKRWPRRVLAEVRDHGVNGPNPEVVVQMPYHAWRGGDRVVILSAAELRYLDACRRELEALKRGAEEMAARLDAERPRAPRPDPAGMLKVYGPSRPRASKGEGSR